MSKKLVWILTAIAVAAIVGWVMITEISPKQSRDSKEAKRGVKPQATAQQNPGAQSPATAKAPAPKQAGPPEILKPAVPAAAKGLPFTQQIGSAEAYDYKTGEKRTIPVTITATTVGDTNNPPGGTIGSADPTKPQGATPASSPAKNE